MKNRILILTLAVLLTAGLYPARAMGAGFRFLDVPADAWYYEDVKNAVDAGLVNGRDETSFCPDGYLTWAEAVKLAASMHQIRTEGALTLENGDPWYRTYADYAKRVGIIASECPWDDTVNRAGYMAVFARALPDSDLEAVNRVDDGAIPDVPANHPQAEGIYKLYRAGVAQGDEEHNCLPADPIRRSEVAAILTRMMDPDKRKSFTLTAPETQSEPEAETETALRIVRNPVSVALASPEETASFAVEVAGGRGPFIYKWVIEKEGTSTPTSGTSVKTVSDYSVTFPKDYFAVTKTVFVYCVVTDSEGRSVTSEKAGVTPYPETLRVTKQPVGVAVKAKGTGGASFTVEIAGGQAPYIYDWKEELSADGRTVSLQKTSGAAKDTLAVEDADQLLALHGAVTVWCVITDSAGAKVTTDRVKLTKSFFEASVDRTAVDLVSPDEIFALEVSVTGGSEPYTYQWYWGTAADKLTDMSGWAQGYDTPTLTARPDARYAVQYMRCRVRDVNGNETFTPVVTITIAVP